MAVYRCKMCGGVLEIAESWSVVTCDYCDTKQTLPRFDSEQKINLYDRASHFRSNNDYDKAMSIYESILNIDTTDAEAYWSILLCRFGIEYVEDPTTHKRLPTINRAQLTSIFADEDYKSAIKYADSAQREIYEEEAKYIDEVQKGILEISRKEAPFDIFICYKETDANGRRTMDSVLATELYYGLVNEGFKVFFARITLEDKLGTDYEPYIFAALNSAKVMVVLGTRPEHFNAVWVKNEWSRYLTLMKSGAQKTLIPAYRDMNPYDLPEEFSYLQAQDMSKLGFMQDLIRGIKKIVYTEETKATVKETVALTGAPAKTSPLLKRAFIFLEDGEWQKADDFCEQVLNQDPECAEAYLGKLMAELHVCKKETLKNQAEPFSANTNYKKIMRFGSDSLKEELNTYIDNIFHRQKIEMENKQNYDSACSILARPNATEADLISAKEVFRNLGGYKNSAKKATECEQKIEFLKKRAEFIRKDNIYHEALFYENKNSQNRHMTALQRYETAEKLFGSIPNFKDADQHYAYCKNQTDQLKKQGVLLGFRSNKLFKKILSVGYLIICGLFAFGMVINGKDAHISVYDFFIEKLYEFFILIWLLAPYIFLSNTNIRNMLPLFKRKKAGWSFLGMVIVEVALFFVIGTTGSLHSQEYQSGVINHDNQVISTTEASCESSGSVHYECKLCGEKTTEEIPAIGHTDDLYCARCGECTFRTLSYSGTGSKAIGCTLPKGKYRVTVTMTSGDGFVDVDVLYSGSGGITSESIRITDAGYWEVATIESSGGSGNIVIQASNDYFGHSGWSIRIELVQ